MDIKKLQSTVVAALEDVKAQDIRVYDTVHLTSLFDRVAIASGTSNRQTKALAASVRDKVKAQGGTILGVEGQETGEWVLVDLGDMIVHIMQPTIRAYYRLEEIWGEKEVKLGAAKRVSTKTTTKTAEATDAAPKKVSRHLTINQATEAPPTKKRSPSKAKPKTATSSEAPKKKTVKPVTRKTSSAPASTVARKKPAVKKASAVPAKVVVKKPAIKKPATKAVTKPAVRKATAKVASKITTKVASKVATKV
ncbi:MAG: ribosome silencing factor, partial [Herbaspirillum sp.]